jgi:hypothetical protein
MGWRWRRCPIGCTHLKILQLRDALGKKAERLLQI